MPLPPRDLSAMHLSLNPALADIHRACPLSRYAPVVAMFRLAKLAADAVPLARILDERSWLTVACLDDATSDACIGHALTAMARGGDAVAINWALVQASAPYLVPMFVPAFGLTPPTVAPPPTLAPPPVLAPPQTSSVPVSSSRSRPRTRRPSASVTHVSESEPLPEDDAEPLAGLAPAVLRAIVAVVKTSGAPLAAFRVNAAALKRLQTLHACKALGEFAKCGDTSAASLAAILARH